MMDPQQDRDPEAGPDHEPGSDRTPPPIPAAKGRDPNQERRRILASRVSRVEGGIDERIEDAIAAVPRERFVPDDVRDDAFADRALPIGQGQTISAPHMVAIMCHVLDLRPGQRVLEVGTGSGYHAAVMAHLVQPGGHVWSIERVPELAIGAASRLQAAHCGDLVEVHHGDGTNGLPEHAPFDRISVAAAAPHVPMPLIDQLGDAGRLIVPIGQRDCILTSYTRHGTDVVRKTHGGCVFVPLIGAHGGAQADGGHARPR